MLDDLEADQRLAELPAFARVRCAVSYAAVPWPIAAHAQVLRVPASTRVASAKVHAPGSRRPTGTLTSRSSHPGPWRRHRHPDSRALYTLGTAELNGEADRLGSITPGKLADLVACPGDPMTADTDDLAELTSTFTMIGGKAVYNPGKRLSH